MDGSPFHSGELHAQRLAGGGSSGAGIRDVMPEQHRRFFPLLRTLFVALPGLDGHPVATVLTGTPGFVTSPDERTLAVAALPDTGSPAAGLLRAGVPVGLLGLEFETRRRNRANGTVTAADGDGFTVAVRQSFGNCAKYIQTRTLRSANPGPGAPIRSNGLPDAAAAMVRAADTFFIASRSAADEGGHGGMDMSHRGGRPGFVRVDGRSLAVPDFRGNRFFNTFGNLLEDPRTGLLFLDFATGDVVEIAGTARMDWTPGPEAPEGAERILRVDVRETVIRPAALPLRAEFGSFAPTTLETGDWR